MPKPEVRVTIDNRSETRFIEDLEVVYENGKHSVVLVTIWYDAENHKGRDTTKWRPNHGFWREGSPITIEWGTWPRSHAKFRGYVEGRRSFRFEDVGNSGARAVVTYVVRGTSRTMQSYRQKNWGNATASSVVRRISKKHGMRPIVDKSGVIFEGLSQNSSDFKYLKELSERSGMSLFVNNGDVRFIDPYRALTERRTGYPTFRMDRAHQTGEQRRDTLRDFTPSTGALLPEGGQATDLVMYVTDPNTGKVMPVRDRYREECEDEDQYEAVVDTEVLYDDRVAQNWSEGRELLKAKKKANRNWVSATARTAGDHRVEPGSVINIQGTALDREDTGLWYVEQVIHRVYRPDRHTRRTTYYELDLVLGRGKREKDVKHYLTPDVADAANTVEVDLVNGKWRARACGSSFSG